MFTGLIEAQDITRLAPRGPDVQIGVHAGQAFVETSRSVTALLAMAHV